MTGGAGQIRTVGRGLGPLAWPRRLTFGAVVATGLLYAVTGFRVDLLVGLLTLGPWVMCIVAGRLAPRIGFERLGAGLELVGLTYLSGMALLLACYPLSANQFEFVDDVLAAADAAIAHDAARTVTLVSAYPDVVAALTFCYRSMNWQPALIVIALVWGKNVGRASALFQLAFWTLVLVVAAFPFLPAEASFAHFGLGRDVLPDFAGTEPWACGPIIAAIKSGAMRTIEMGQITGMTTFPSYHTVSAILFIWAAWPTPLRWPLLIVNIGLIGGSLVIGAHYLVDILAGIAVALVAIKLRWKHQAWPGREDPSPPYFFGSAAIRRRETLGAGPSDR